jgi:hypothetical protein
MPNVIIGSENTTVYHLFGQWVPTATPGEFVWVDGPLARSEDVTLVHADRIPAETWRFVAEVYKWWKRVPDIEDAVQFATLEWVENNT